MRGLAPLVRHSVTKHEGGGVGSRRWRGSQSRCTASIKSRRCDCARSCNALVVANTRGGSWRAVWLQGAPPVNSAAASAWAQMPWRFWAHVVMGLRWGRDAS